ncbi:hypothetical protein [Notoacmeibacter marinus]|uniref:hypothetical protein n=1 Tax=Notoacmeibacter marinus TaxID=1876515 RepID=UPI00117AECAF|nr:hypothetical protein [Notoacmeibacter marinus]
MTLVLEPEALESFSDCHTNQCVHEAAQGGSPVLCSTDEGMLRKYDAEMVDAALAYGVLVESPTLDDYKLAGDKTDEAIAANQYRHGENDDHLFKHCIAVRKGGNVLEIQDSFMAKRNQILSEVFGNGITRCSKFPPYKMIDP